MSLSLLSFPRIEFFETKEEIATFVGVVSLTDNGYVKFFVSTDIIIRSRRQQTRLITQPREPLIARPQHDFY